jgi:hypothetical protein
MKTKSGLRFHFIVPEVILALAVSPFAYAAPQQGQSSPTPSAASTSPQPADDDNAPVPPMPPADAAAPASSSDQLPDSPGAVESAQLEAQPPAQPPAQQPQPQPAQQQPPKEPLGTAAAQTVPTMGVAASKPAGAALAPAKQRRIRTILIRTGAIVGAAAAVGVTMALTEASPSKPPGAH